MACSHHYVLHIMLHVHASHSLSATLACSYTRHGESQACWEMQRVILSDPPCASGPSCSSKSDKKRVDIELFYSKCAPSLSVCLRKSNSGTLSLITGSDIADNTNCDTGSPAAPLCNDQSHCVPGTGVRSAIFCGLLGLQFSLGTIIYLGFIESRNIPNADVTFPAYCIVGIRSEATITIIISPAELKIYCTILL